MFRPRFLKRLILRLRGELPIETLMARGLSVGRDCHVMERVSFDPSHCWLIEIGDRVTIAPEVLFFAHDANMHRALGSTFISKIRVGNDVFIGARSIILPGVTIGPHSIVGAGSVVACDVPAGMVVAGNPTRVLCSVNDLLAKHKQQMKTLPCFGEAFTIRQAISNSKRQKMKRALKKRGGYVV